MSAVPAPSQLSSPYASSYAPAVSPSIAVNAPSTAPRLLEYRSEADPEAEFIPKTLGGFCFGAMALGFCINLGQTALNYGIHNVSDIASAMLIRFAFMVGIVGVAASLLLVGVKVRAEKSSVDLHSRHWINSITTGAIYALMIWCPWFLIERHDPLMINRFVAAAVWMILMVYPLIAAKWTIGPARTFGHQ